MEPATFRFVAQHLNHCATAVHKTYTKVVVISIEEKYKEGKSRNFFLTAPLIRRAKDLCYIKYGFEFRLDIHVYNPVLGKDIWIGTHVDFTWY
jgi:hypothetical protein